MKLKIATLFIAAWCISGLFAQKQWVSFKPGQAGEPQINLVQQDESKLIIDIVIQGMYVSEIQQDGIKYRKLELFPFQTTQEIGKPELPVIAKTIGIPNNQLVDVKIENAESILLKDYLVYPFQTPTTDNKGAKKYPFTIDQAFYSTSNAYPQANALVDNIGIWRDIKVGGLKIIPFDYNVATKELKVFTKIRVTVTFSGYDSKINVNRGKKVSSNFYRMYQHAIYNFSSLGLSTDAKDNTEPLYLIITNTEAVATIQPLIDWKNRQGYRVEVKTLGAGFNTPQHFKDYITNLYNTNTNPLEYILMVGDAYPNGGSGGGNNIVPMYYWAPAGEDASYSDTWYGCMDGADDHFADIAVGRYVYDNLTELDLQIDKTMDHYFNPDTVANWAQNSLLIAHQEDYPGKYTQCCEEIRTFSYTKQTPVFTTAYGGAGATNTDVINFVNNNACGIFNYRGHGSATEMWDWGSSGSFTNTHVQQLTNANRLFVFFDVCCDNMDIVAHSGNCLCESFMKSPVASVAVNGAIIPSYTIPNHDYDKEMYKAVFNQGISNIGYVTNYANITVLNVHGTIGRSNVRTYLWLGDPSLEPWTKKPIELTVDHTPQLFLGLSEFPVSVSNNAGPVADALVCVSNNDGTIYGRAYTNASGEAVISFAEPVNVPGAVMVTVTKFNHKPYLNTITAIPQSGPYVIKDVYQINDPTGNNNHQLDYGETATVTLTMKNVGVTMANNVDVIIRSSDPYINITDSIANFGNIDSNAAITVTNAFALSALQSIPDNHNIRINVEATDGDSIWNSAFYITAHAPVLEIGNIAVTNDNNANNRLDPGETGNIVLNVINKGHADCKNPVAIMMGNSPYLTITENTIDIDTIGFGDTAAVTFSVAAHAATTNGHTVNLDFTVFETDSVFDTKELIIGIPPEKPIGNGTTASSNYPFYTYYENNKTQIIYLGSEIGAGPQTIKEIAFDFNQLGTTITSLTNLTIKFKKTSLAQFGTAYADMTGATTVFTSATYTMPAATGWCVFDITDYAFNGADTNLIVEIVWGDNGAWSNTFYKVNCTDAGSPKVAYGYSDTQNPPAFNNTSNNRPNIKLFFIANASGTAYDVPFKVIDGGTMAPIPTAAVKIGSLQKNVNPNGITIFNLIEGTYEYAATAPIYNPINNQAFTIANADTIIIQMSSAPLRTVDFMVVDSITSNPISGAVITINTTAQTTSTSGVAAFNLYDGNYTYTVNATDYADKTAQINVNGNASHTIQLVSNVGIAEVTNVEINVYPNPAKNQLFVQANGNIKQLKIVDLQGKTVFEKIYSTKNINVSLSQIENGTYFIYLQTEQGLVIKKIAVVK